MKSQVHVSFYTFQIVLTDKHSTFIKMQSIAFAYQIIFSGFYFIHL